MSGAVAAELDLENLLLRIPHVLGARVQMGRGGSVERIHVLANRAARTEQVAREIERLLRERRALRVDPDVISVVSLDENGKSAPRAEPAEEEHRPPPPKPTRIQFRRLTFLPIDELQIRATVELRLDEIVFNGEASDTDVPPARPPLAARAVLRALDYLREQGVAFYLQGIEFLPGFRTPVALAMVQVISNQGEKRGYSGCALVTESREHAAARATLAAINRFYGRFTNSAHP